MTKGDIPYVITFSLAALILFGWAFYGLHRTWRLTYRRIKTRISGKALQRILLFAFSLSMAFVAVFTTYLSFMGTGLLLAFLFDKFGLYGLTEPIFHMRDREDLAWMAVGMVVTPLSLLFITIAVLPPVVLSEVRLKRHNQ